MTFGPKGPIRFLDFLASTPDGYLHAPNNGQIVANAWEAYVEQDPVDNIYEDYWLFYQFSKGDGFKGVNGGRTFNGPLVYALNTTVQSYTDTDTFSTARVDVFDEFTYNPKEYVGVAVMSELEKAKNQGSGRKFDLQGGKLDNLRMSMRKLLNDDMFGDGTTNNSKAIGGLQLGIATAPTTGTVGSIPRATFTFWRNQQTSGAQTSTAFDNLRSTMRSVYNLCGAGVASTHPTFAVTTRTVFEGYEGLLTTNERYTDKKSGDAGFKNEVLKFKDIPIAYDKAAPSGNLYFINTEYVKLAYQKGYWFKGFPAVDPANQTIDVFKVMTIANLIFMNPRRTGVVSSIT